MSRVVRRENINTGEAEEMELELRKTSGGKDEWLNINPSLERQVLEFDLWVT